MARFETYKNTFPHARLTRTPDGPSLLGWPDELTGAEASVALQELPEAHRTAIEGRVLEEESYDALAARLRCSNSVVRQRVSRGLRMMHDRLEGLA